MNFSRKFYTALIVVVVAPSILAELPVARLSTIFPAGGKIGTTFEMSVTGVDLEESQIQFSNPDLLAKPIIAEATGQQEANKFLVTISPEAPAGIYEARVLGRFGLSNPRAFVIGDLPEISEPTTNRTAATASDISLGSVVNGRSEANAEDWFRFSARRGQRVLVECLARTIDSRLDPVVVLLDLAGRELDRNRRGGLLDFTAPADGAYVLKVHDFLFRGGEEYFYRLAVGTGPRLDFIFPPAGLAGAKSKYLLYGRNLPGASPAKAWSVDGKLLEQLEIEIELPADPASALRSRFLSQPMAAVVEGMDYRLNTPQGSSNPVLLSYATAPVVLEMEPNDQPGQAQKIELPCELAGQFYPPGDRDWVTFNAQKDAVYWVEVFSQRLGLPTDPFVLVQRVKKNDQGEEEVSDVKEMYDSEDNFGGPEFKTNSRDPAWRFEVKEDGTYRIQIRDLFNRAQGNPGLVYRLSLRKEAPDFRLVALPQAPPPANKDAKEAKLWTPLLRRDETLPVKIIAFRRDNFTGEIQLSAEDLPPGVAVSEAKVDADKSSSMLMLTAAAAATNWAGTVRIVGRAKIGGNDRVRSALGGLVVWNVNDYNLESIPSRLTSDFTLAVSGQETSPVAVQIEAQPAWETSVAGKLQIPVKLARSDDFKAALKLKATGLAALDSLKELELDGKTNQALLELDLTKNKLGAGSYSFYLQGQTQGKYRRQSAEEVKSLEDAAKQAEKAAADLAEADKQASEALATATKGVEESEAQSKAASEKLAAAKEAAEKSPESRDLLVARTAAEQAAAEAATKSKDGAVAKISAEKAALDAAAKAKEASQKKEEATKRLKETDKKDVTITLYSPPIRLKITPAPITMSVQPPGTPMEQGSKFEIPITLNRLYGFMDPVELGLISPKDVPGLTAAKVTIPKDETQGKLVIEAGANAKPGEHKVIIQAALKLNGQDLNVDQSVTLNVVEMPKAKSP